MSAATSSRIRYTCPCGKKYVARAELSGKRAKCKECGEAFTIPTPQQAEVETHEKTCPWCGVRIEPNKTFCKACKRKMAERADGETFVSWRGIGKNLLVAAICTATVLIASVYQQQLDGPEFISFYTMMAIACCIGLLVARLTHCSVVTFIVLLVAYEAIGAIRYGYGIQHGMHKFGKLTSMMIIGPFIIVAIPFIDKLGNSQGSSSGGGGWFASGCSSCGSGCGSGCGGGCGGGGCGGCGS